MMVRDRIDELVRHAIARAQEEGALPAAPVPDVAVERPQNSQHGDFATSLPLRLARATRINPMVIAEALAKRIPTGGEIAKVDVARPGFINFTLSTQWLQGQVAAIARVGEHFGDTDTGKGAPVMIEFVSVNPTGPMHVGHARGAVIGSSLAEVMRAAGYAVSREYYVNDAGNQMDLFYRSVLARYRQHFGREAEMPEKGYVGAYVVDLAKAIAGDEGDRFLGMSEGDALSSLGAIALERMLAAIREDLAAIGVAFDTWFHERTLFDGGQYDTVMSMLKERGFLAERDGALMFLSSALGEDKDNVLVRSTGAPTYFATDIAYHYNKFVERGFNHVINIWGADHHGHVSRLKAAASALGVDPERLTILLVQIVTLKRGGDTVRASKRKGEMVTLRELVEEVGADACRYFFLARTVESQMEFDLDLATKQSSDNPVFYVQYAYARMAGILRQARERGPTWDWSQAETMLLRDPNELALIRKMLQLPELVEAMAKQLSPHLLPHYALELATAFHWFYENCRVISSDNSELPLSLARLKLVDACRTVLGRSLRLMLMSTPERM